MFCSVNLTMDAFIEVPRQEWPSLINLYKGHDGLTARTSLKAQIYEKDKNEDFFQTKIYIPFGEREEGMFILWKLIEGVWEQGVYSPKKNPTRMFEALHKTKLIHWNTHLIFTCVMPNCQQPIHQLLNDFKIEYKADDVVVAHLPLEKVENFVIELPNDVELKLIGTEFAAEIDDCWPSRYPGSIKYFEGMLRRGAGLGILSKNNNLYGWVFISCRGSIHSLFVKQEHRRKGYAQILVKGICKEIVRRDGEIFGLIVTRNGPSKSLFQRLGFELLSVARLFHCNK